MTSTPGDDHDDWTEAWVEAVVSTSSPAELTTVGSRFAVVHEGETARRYDDLEPDTEHDIEGFAFRTLPEPGPLLATFATVNDVHFGETEAGVIDGSDIGPTFSAAPGAEPYPEMMNRCAVREITEIDPDVVVVKGDLTSGGTAEEYEQFLAMYQPAFEGRLVVVRGNHESYHHAQVAAHPWQRIDLPGVTIAVLDTSVDGSPAGTVRDEQLAWLDDVGATADQPVLVFGHHHLGDPTSREKADHDFGIDLAASAALRSVVARRPRLRGYFCGHTHRNRVRHFDDTGDVPWVEVACVKDYPGAWAEYRVHEGGILQVLHRISAPEALAWTEQTRHMYAGTYHDYAFGTLADRCFLLPGTPAPAGATA